jgi:hypothetical protein
LSLRFFTTYSPFKKGASWLVGAGGYIEYPPLMTLPHLVGGGKVNGESGEWGVRYGDISALL